MSALKVRVLRRAVSDIDGIVKYLRGEASDEAIASVDEIINVIASLERFPGIGPAPRDPGLAARGYRVVRSGRYLIFYKILGAQIRVYRILHGRRDYSTLL